MKNLLLLLSLTMLLSCKKETDDNVSVNQDNLRVYSMTAYYDNGNIATHTRYSYYPDGMIKRDCYFAVYDENSTDTINVERLYHDYERPNDTTIMIITHYYDVLNTEHRDTTLLKLDASGMAKESYRIHRFFNRHYYSKLAYDVNGYNTSGYSIDFTGDSIVNDNSCVRASYRNEIINGNCSRSIDHYTRIFGFDTTKINTLNFGQSFLGRINKNPVIIQTYDNDTVRYSYEYKDGRIHSSNSQLYQRDTPGYSRYYYTYVEGF